VWSTSTPAEQCLKSLWICLVLLQRSRTHRRNGRRIIELPSLHLHFFGNEEMMIESPVAKAMA
jgi:hypothetical protein